MFHIRKKRGRKKFLLAVFSVVVACAIGLYGFYVFIFDKIQVVLEKNARKFWITKVVIGNIYFVPWKGIVLKNVSLNRPFGLGEELVVHFEELSFAYPIYRLFISQPKEFLGTIHGSGGSVIANGEYIVFDDISGSCSLVGDRRLEFNDVSADIGVTPFSLSLLLNGYVAGAGQRGPEVYCGITVAGADEGVLGEFTLEGIVPSLVLSGGFDLGERGKIDINAAGDAGALSADIFVNHLKIYENDMVSRFAITAKKTRSPETHLSFFEADFHTGQTVINYMPFYEVAGAFTCDYAHLNGAVWTEDDAYRLEGALTLQAPYDINAQVRVQEVALEEIYTMFIAAGTQKRVTGVLDGSVAVTGPVIAPLIKGQVTARDGWLGSIEYEHAMLHFAGEAPVLIVQDGRITKGDRSLLVSGFLDLTAARTKAGWKTLRIYSDQNSIVWKGWDIIRNGASEGLNLEKTIDERVSIGVTTYANNEMNSASMEKEGEVVLECKFDENKAFRFQTKGDDDFFGVQHKKEF